MYFTRPTYEPQRDQQNLMYAQGIHRSASTQSDECIQCRQGTQLTIRSFRAPSPGDDMVT